MRALPRGTLSRARQVWRDLTERFKVLRVKNTFLSADAAETYGMMQVASRRVAGAAHAVATVWHGWAATCMSGRVATRCPTRRLRALWPFRTIRRRRRAG